MGGNYLVWCVPHLASLFRLVPPSPNIQYCSEIKIYYFVAVGFRNYQFNVFFFFFFSKETPNVKRFCS